MAKKKGDPFLKCSFCKKSEKDAEHMVVVPGARICDECVTAFAAIVEKGRAKNKDITEGGAK